MLIMETVGPRAEELADEALSVIDADVAVGFDTELDSATFDSDELDDAALESAVTDALDGIDSDWGSHLRVAE
jgi:hypothetical protein